MIIDGYMVKTTSMNVLEQTLNDIRSKLKLLVNREYLNLLGKEIAFLVDQITLGNISRDSNITIYEGAVGNVQSRMSNAASRNIPSDFNFNIFAHILVEEDAIYLKIISPNKKLLSAFKNLENVSLSEEEGKDEKNRKTILWNKLHKKYKNNEPCMINLTQYPEFNFETDKDKIKYPSVTDRITQAARHSVIMHLLSQYGGGEQIPEIRLMSYIDDSLEALTKNADVQAEYREKIGQLHSIMIDLEKDNAFVFTLDNGKVVDG